ncbi:IclR family transcriptional regulator [Microbulbifer marinus]|uniref:Transcriptional regulator, IclR family n=1 Tax=Microbulbifer marinus TaxID=658218 RepID=A0A1H3W0P7_9GAMM|nr:IclR family transcriptional regulator [Microbulbifer marinus]SDZ80643.1 transcriptional regulator, IclR family [Microbulbifer marinus]
MTNSDKPFSRMLRIMDVVSAHPSGATMAEMVEQLDIPISSIYRLVKNLVDEEYLQGGGRHGRYRLGRRFLRQYHSSVATRNLVELVRPTLRHLCDQFDEVVYFNSLTGLTIRPVCAEFPHSEKARTVIMPGDFFPVHASASGKVLCAYQEPAVQKEMLGSNELEQFRPNTITDRKALEEEFDKVKKQGYALIDDELDENVFAMSVPIHSDNAGVIYSLAVVCVKERLLSRMKIPEVARLLRQGANEISQTLTSNPLSYRFE